MLASSFIWFAPAPTAPEIPAINTLVVGWDGSNFSHIESLLKAGKLPVLKSVIDKGSLVRLNVGDARTDTKAGWSQIFSGYSAAITGVYSNSEYRPIPPGYSVFERLKSRYGDNIRILFVSGKANNIGARGPHRVCSNCLTRFEDTRGKTYWWDEKVMAPVKGGGPRIYEKKEGEPYFHAIKSMDVYKNALGGGEKVLTFAINAFNQLNGKRFFAFIHFEEPDEKGHLHAGGSPEYIQSIVENDRRLGRLLKAVESLGAAGELRLVILGDHGFTENKKHHRRAGSTFLASNIPGMKESGDRRDAGATFLQFYKFDFGKIHPPINGAPLSVK